MVVLNEEEQFNPLAIDHKFDSQITPLLLFLEMDAHMPNVMPSCASINAMSQSSSPAAILLKNTALPLDTRMDVIQFARTVVSSLRHPHHSNVKMSEDEQELKIIAHWTSQENRLNLIPSTESIESSDSTLSSISCSTGSNNYNTTELSKTSSLSSLIDEKYFTPKRKNTAASRKNPQDLKHLQQGKPNMKKKKFSPLLNKDSFEIPKKTGIFFSVFNLINDILSPGTLSMSQMTAQSGIFSSYLLTFLFGAVTLFTLCLLYELRRNHLKSSLIELSEKAFGKLGVIFTSIAIILFNFGGALGMFIMFGHMVPDLLQQWKLQFYNPKQFDSQEGFVSPQLQSIHEWISTLTSRTAVLIYLTLLMIPFALRKQLTSYAFTSFLSVSSVFVIGAWLAYEAVSGNKRFVPPPSDALNFVRGSQFFSALGALAFIYVCHDICFHIFEGLKRPTRLRFFVVALCVVLLTIVTIITVGTSGFLLFYDRCLNDANVLNLFPLNDPWAIAARVLLSCNILLSIPYALFMPRDCLKQLLILLIPKRVQKGSVWTSFKKSALAKELGHVVLTLFILCSAFGIAVAVNDLGIVSDLFGAVAAASLAYIIPPALFLKLEFSWCGGCLSGETALKRWTSRVFRRKNGSLNNAKMLNSSSELIEMSEQPVESQKTSSQLDQVAMANDEFYYQETSISRGCLKLCIGLTCIFVLMLGLLTFLSTIVSVAFNKLS